MKKRNRKLLFRNIIKALPVLAGVALVVYLVPLLRNIEFPVVLPVDEIHVQGELNFLHKSAITETVKNNISGGYFTVDLKHVRDILLQEPWVSEVALRRQWPAGINVVIEEKKPVAFWNDEAYISSKGDVFKPASVDRTLRLPVLNGPEGQHNNVWKFMNVLYREMAALDYEVKRLRLDDRRAWQLEIAKVGGNDRNTENVKSANNIGVRDISVRLGRFDTEKRMQRFINILPALASEMHHQGKIISAIDMRYPNGFAVQTGEA